MRALLRARIFSFFVSTTVWLPSLSQLGGISLLQEETCSPGVASVSLLSFTAKSLLTSSYLRSPLAPAHCLQPPPPRGTAGGKDTLPSGAMATSSSCPPPAASLSLCGLARSCSCPALCTVSFLSSCPLSEGDPGPLPPAVSHPVFSPCLISSVPRGVLHLALILHLLLTPHSFHLNTPKPQCPRVARS